MYNSLLQEKQRFQDRDESFRVRLGRIKVASEESLSKGIYQRISGAGPRSFSKVAKKTIQSALKRRGNMFAYSRKRFPQRVVVKTHYVKHKGVAKGAASLRSHTRYLARDGAGADGKNAPFYGAKENGLDPKEFVDLCKNDRHHFRSIISPEHGQRIKDFEGYVRKTMALIERDLGTKLDWRAVNHFNTDQPHAHVVIRGVDDKGNDLVIAEDYIKHGMRARAQEVCTELLRERSLKEIHQSLEKEVEAERYTSLDSRIEKRLSENRIVDARPSMGVAKNDFHENLIRGRLQYLEKMGLATLQDTGIYRLSENMRRDLRALSQRNDIIKNIYARIGTEASHAAIHSIGQFKPKSLSGRVLDKGLHDEITDKRYIVIRDAGGRPHYIDVGRNPEFDYMQRGSLVRLAQPEKSRGKADYNILTLAKNNKDEKGVYDVARHLAYVEKSRTDITPEKRDQYIQRHITRLETLEKSGVVESLGDGRFKVPLDLIAKGKEVSEKINEKSFIKLRVISEKPVESQIDAEAWTWLDRELYKRSRKAEPSLEYDGVIKGALKQRMAWLEKNRYADVKDGVLRMKPGTADKLKEAELVKAGQKLALQTGKPYEKISNKKEQYGKYHGIARLHSGRYAVIESNKAVSLAPVSQALNIEQGALVSLKSTGRGRFFVTELSRDKDLGQ